MSQEQHQAVIQNIHDEAFRLNTLTSAFLDLARLESGRARFNFTRFDLIILLDECIETMQGKAGENHVTVEREAPADFPQVEADRDKIKQMVLNLLSNAIKYNYPNGLVTIILEMEGKDWKLSVRDTGTGIPAKALPYLFQKFYRVESSEGKVPGTGLGLSICKQIISAHGGTIEAASTYGKGQLSPFESLAEKITESPFSAVFPSRCLPVMTKWS